MVGSGGFGSPRASSVFVPKSHFPIHVNFFAFEFAGIAPFVVATQLINLMKGFKAAVRGLGSAVGFSIGEGGTVVAPNVGEPVAAADAQGVQGLWGLRHWLASWRAAHL